MAEQTFIACPLCGEPIVMSPMQLDIYRGRALTCARCARQFVVDPKRTPLYSLSETGGAKLVNPPAPPPAAPDAQPGNENLQTAPSASATGSPAAASPAKRRAGTGGWKMVVGIVGGFFIVAAIAVALVTITLRRAEEDTSRVRCAANMTQINTAIQSYARTNGGRFPDSIDRLLLAQTITPTAFICASTSDTPAIGGTPQAWVLAMQQSGHQSYVYVGQNLTIASAAQQTPSPVVMYEPMVNHHDDGSTVLYADGSVAFVDRVSSKALISRLTATPAPSTTTQSVGN